MKRSLTLFLLLSGSFLQLSAQPELKRDRLVWFGQQLEQLRQDLNIPGMSALLIEGDRVIWKEGFGWANLELEIPASASTCYRIASCGKPVSAFMLIEMERAGKISLEQTLESYSIPVPKSHQITIRQVVNHTSTLPPGKRFQYNGKRFGFLDSLFHRVEGVSFGEVLYKYYIEPLGLTHTAPSTGNPDMPVDIADPRFVLAAENQAVNYDYNEEGMPVRHGYTFGCGAPGGWFSSVEDYGSFLIAQDTLLPKEWQDQLYTSTRPKDGKPFPMGLGWFVQEVIGHQVAWHWGWNPPGVSSLVIQDRTSGLKLVLFANSERLSQPFALHRGELLNSPAALVFFRSLVFTPEEFHAISDREEKAWEIIGYSTGEMDPVVGLERLLLWFIFILMLTPLILWPLGFLLRKVSAVKQEKMPTVFRYGAGFAIPRYVAGVAVVFCFLVNLMLRIEPQLIYWPELPGWMAGLPLYQNIFLMLPSLLVILAGVQILFSVWLWASRKGTRVFRIHYSLVTLLVIVYVWFLNEWNLVDVMYYLEWL